MKKIILASLLVMGGFIAVSAQGYYPDDRNSGQSTDQYYYYPDDNVYYYPYTNNYIYYDQNRWCTSSYLPQNFRFNNSSFSVSINYRGNSIWNLNNDHRRQYRNNSHGSHNNRYGRNNGYRNSFPGRDNGHYNERSYNQRNRGDHGNGRKNGRH